MHLFINILYEPSKPPFNILLYLMYQNTATNAPTSSTLSPPVLNKLFTHVRMLIAMKAFAQTGNYCICKQANIVFWIWHFKNSSHCRIEILLLFIRVDCVHKSDCSIKFRIYWKFNVMVFLIFMLLKQVPIINTLESSRPISISSSSHMMPGH